MKEKWYKKDGIIHLSSPTISDGAVGAKLIESLEQKGIQIDYKSRKNVLQLNPTKGVNTDIVILPGRLWWHDQDRTTENICSYAQMHNFSSVNSEITCFICEMFTYEEIQAMGFRSIVIIHESIKGFNDDLRLISVLSYFNDRSFRSYWGGLGAMWKNFCGFAFSCSQVS